MLPVLISMVALYYHDKEITCHYDRGGVNDGAAVQVMVEMKVMMVVVIVIW